MLPRICVALLAALLIVPGPADAGRLRLMHSAPSGSAPLAPETVYFGSETTAGGGGADICNAPCVEPWTITSAAPLNFFKDDVGKLAAKDGAAAYTYNALRTTGPITGSEVFTITDAIGQTKVVTATADDNIAGTYTVTNKDGVDGVGGVVPQFIIAIRDAAYGDTIAWRNGSSFNTTNNTGTYTGGDYNVRSNSLFSGTFTGSNYVVMRPETGGVTTFGRLDFDGQNANRLDGMSIENFNWYLANPSLAMLASTDGVTHFRIQGNTFQSAPDTLTTTVARSDGIAQPQSAGYDGDWIINDNDFLDVGTAISLKNPQGTANMGAGTYSDPTGIAHTVTNNRFRRVSGDVIDIACATGPTVTGNISYDKFTGVTIGAPYYNPFNTGAQPHSDFYQANMTSCGFGTYAGGTISGNYILRGDGRDSLDFWTSPPYPTPNSPGSPTTPNPSMGYTDYQGGLFFSGQAPGSAFRTSYPAILINPVMERNFFMGVGTNGLFFQYAQNATVRFNTIINDYPGPANLVTSPFGSASIQVGELSGTGNVVQYNVSVGALSYTLASGAAVDRGSGSGAGGTTNTTTNYAGYAAAFIAPQPKRRTTAEVAAGFSPQDAGPLETGANIFAGVYCADGSLQTGSPCP